MLDGLRLRERVRPAAQQTFPFICSLIETSSHSPSVPRTITALATNVRKTCVNATRPTAEHLHGATLPPACRWNPTPTGRHLWFDPLRAQPSADELHYFRQRIPGLCQPR